MEVAKEATEVTLNEVVGWLLAALELAKADTDGEEGRRLSITFFVGPGGANVEVTTWNLRDAPRRWWEYGRETADGALVVWSTKPSGLPTGSDWLPEAFVNWVMGEGGK